MSQEETLNKVYVLTQQLQILEAQKQSLVAEKSDIDLALKELKPGEECYRLVGSVLIKKNHEELKNELEERKMEIEEGLKIIETQKEKTREKIKELQKSFQPEAG